MDDGIHFEHLLKHFSGAKVCFNTENLQYGEVFIALPGSKKHGNYFIKEAIAKGASLLVLEKPVFHVDFPRVIWLDDTKQFLAELALWRRKLFKGKVLAITGSVGKTSIKNGLTDLLSRKNFVHSSFSSFNNWHGLNHTLANLPADFDYAILEIGTNKRGEILNLAKIVRPNLSIINRIGPVHAAGIGLDQIIHEKTDLLRATSDMAVVHHEIADFARNLNLVPIYSFGWKNNEFACVKDFGLTNCGYLVKAVIDRFAVEFVVKQLGEHRILNHLAMLTAAYLLGKDIYEISRIVGLDGAEGRGKVFSYKGAVILDESFNSNPLALTEALRTLADLPVKRRFAVLGDMLELGEKESEFHEQVKIPDNVEYVITSGNLAANIKRIAGRHFATTSEIADFLCSELQEGDGVLVKASRSMRFNEIIKRL